MCERWRSFARGIHIRIVKSERQSAAEECKAIRQARREALLRCDRGVEFEVEVFSLDDICNKSIGGLNADVPVSILVEKIKLEFGISSRQQIQLTLGDHDLLPNFLDTPLGK